MHIGVFINKEIRPGLKNRNTDNLPLLFFFWGGGVLFIKKKVLDQNTVLARAGSYQFTCAEQTYSKSRAGPFPEGPGCICQFVIRSDGQLQAVPADYSLLQQVAGLWVLKSHSGIVNPEPETLIPVTPR